MKYSESGKRSKAWWLQSIKWFGDNGTAGIVKGADIASYHVKDAVKDLAGGGMVVIEGEVSRGKRPKYHLTAEGSRYLEENKHELETDESKPVYTWKFMLGGIRYFMDGKIIASSLVPPDELKRIQSESKEKVADTVPDLHWNADDKYTWKRPISGPVRYFKNGEFILETKIPEPDMKRMLAEQNPAGDKPLEYHKVPQSPPKFESAIPDTSGTSHVIVADGPPKKTKPLLDVGIAKVVPVRASELMHDPHEAPEIQAAQKQLHRAALEQSGVPVEPDAKQDGVQDRVQVAPQSFNTAFREILIEILLEKFAHMVTAADVMERLERKV